MKLSITLPSIDRAALSRTLTNIEATTRCDYEVVVVSPDQPVGEIIGCHVYWVPDHSMMGANAGHALALPYASGELILPFVDDHLFIDGWDVLAIEEFERNEGVHPFALGLRAGTHVGTVFGIYYPYFPLMRLNGAKYSGWFDPLYRKGFADADLGLKVWSQGGKAIWSKFQSIIWHPDDERKGTDPHTTEDDMALFLKRWDVKYGRGCITPRALRDFNRDVLIPSDRNTFSPNARADANNCFAN